MVKAVIVTGAEPFTLENPLESAVYEELTSATSTPSAVSYTHLRAHET